MSEPQKNIDLSNRKLFNGVAEITGHNMYMNAASAIVVEAFLAAMARTNVLKKGNNFYLQKVEEDPSNGEDYIFSFLVPSGFSVKGVSLIDYSGKLEIQGSPIKYVDLDLCNIPVKDLDEKFHSPHRVENYKIGEDWNIWRIVIKKIAGGEDRISEKVQNENFIPFIIRTDSGPLSKVNISYIAFFKDEKDGADIVKENSASCKIREYVSNLIAGNRFGPFEYKRYEINLTGPEVKFSEIEEIKPVETGVCEHNPAYPYPGYVFKRNAPRYNFTGMPVELTPSEIINSEEYKRCFFARQMLRRINGDQYPDDSKFLKNLREKKTSEHKFPKDNKELTSIFLDVSEERDVEFEEICLKTLGLKSEEATIEKFFSILDSNAVKNYSRITGDITDYLYLQYFYENPGKKASEYIEERIQRAKKDFPVELFKKTHAESFGIKPMESQNRVRRGDFPIVLPTYRSDLGMYFYPEQNNFTKNLLELLQILTRKIEPIFINKSAKLPSFIDLDGHGMISCHTVETHRIFNLYLKNPQMMKLVSGCSANHIPSLQKETTEVLVKSKTYGYGCLNILAIKELCDYFSKDLTGTSSNEIMWKDTIRDSVFNEIIGMTTTQLEELFFKDASLYSSFGGTNDTLASKIVSYRHSWKKSLTKEEAAKINQEYCAIMSASIKKYIKKLYYDFQAKHELVDGKRSITENKETITSEQVSSVTKNENNFIRILHIGPSLECVSRLVKGGTYGSSREDTTKITYCTDDPYSKTWNVEKKIIDRRKKDRNGNYDETRINEIKYCEGGLVFGFDTRLTRQNDEELYRDYRCPYGSAASHVHYLMNMIGPHCKVFVPNNMSKRVNRSGETSYELITPDHNQVFFHKTNGGSFPFSMSPFNYGFGKNPDKLNEKVFEIYRLWEKYIMSPSFIEDCKKDGEKDEILFSLYLAEHLRVRSGLSNPSIYQILPFDEINEHVEMKNIDYIPNIQTNFIKNCNSNHVSQRKKIISEVLKKFNRKQSIDEYANDLSPITIVNAYLLRSKFEQKDNICMSKFDYVCLSASAYYNQNNIRTMDQLISRTQYNAIDRLNSAVFANLSNAPLWGKIDPRQNNIFFKTMNPAFSVLTTAFYYFSRAIPSEGRSVGFEPLLGTPVVKATGFVIDKTSENFLIRNGAIASSSVSDGQKTAKLYSDVLSSNDIQFRMSNKITEQNDNTSDVEFISLLESAYQTLWSGQTEKSVRLLGNQAITSQKARETVIKGEEERNNLNVVQTSRAILEIAARTRKSLEEMQPKNRIICSGISIEEMATTSLSFMDKTITINGDRGGVVKYAAIVSEELKKKYIEEMLA